MEGSCEDRPLVTQEDDCEAAKTPEKPQASRAGDALKRPVVFAVLLGAVVLLGAACVFRVSAHGTPLPLLASDQPSQLYKKPTPQSVPNDCHSALSCGARMTCQTQPGGDELAICGEGCPMSESGNNLVYQCYLDGGSGKPLLGNGEGDGVCACVPKQDAKKLAERAAKTPEGEEYINEQKQIVKAGNEAGAITGKGYEMKDAKA